jgi:hypothetical protein
MSHGTNSTGSSSKRLTRSAWGLYSMRRSGSYRVIGEKELNCYKKRTVWIRTYGAGVLSVIAPTGQISTQAPHSSQVLSPSSTVPQKLIRVSKPLLAERTGWDTN